MDRDEFRIVSGRDIGIYPSLALATDGAAQRISAGVPYVRMQVRTIKRFTDQGGNETTAATHWEDLGIII